MSKKIMFFVLVFVSFLIVGCAAAKHNYEDCLDDVDCLSKMEHYGAITKSVTNTVVPAPFNPEGILGLSAGGLVSLLVGMIAGRKLNEKKTEV